MKDSRILDLMLMSYHTGFSHATQSVGQLQPDNDMLKEELAKQLKESKKKTPEIIKP